MAITGWRTLRERVTWPVLAGDLACFVVFAAIGHRDHGESGSLLSVIGTAVPFMAGWLLVAPWAGVYRSLGGREARPLLMRTVAGWCLAWPVALAIRAITLHRGIPVSFALVALLANAVLLLCWRSFLTLGLAGRFIRLQDPRRPR